MVESCKLTPAEATKLVKSSALKKAVKVEGELVEKSVEPEIWTKLHAQIFQSRYVSFLIRDNVPYDIGAGVDSVFAAGTGGPYSLLVTDLNGDGVDDLIYADKTIMSGVWYDNLGMFDGKTGNVFHGQAMMCKEVVLSLEANGKVLAKVDKELFHVTLAPSSKAGEKAKLQLSPVAPH